MFKLLELRHSFNTLMLFKILKLLNHATLIKMLKIAQMLNMFDLLKLLLKWSTMFKIYHSKNAKMFELSQRLTSSRRVNDVRVFRT